MLTEYAMTFISLEIVYIAIVIYVAIKTNNNIGTIAEMKHLRFIEGLFIIQAVTQLFWIADDMGLFTMPRVISWIVNFAYVLALGLSLFEWLCFVAENVRYSGKTRLWRFVIRLQTVIAVVHMLFIASSFWTGWVFYIDKAGAYQRGNLVWLNVLLCYSHWIWTVLLMLLNLKNTGREVRTQLQKLLLVSLLPVFGGVLQYLFYNVPFMESAGMLCIFFVFTVLQNNQIKTDALTGLNNRAQFERDYDRMVSKADSEPFVLMIADINQFKQINDTYGHLAGDQALLLVAEGLKQCGKRHPSLGIYRYGGDEFVLLIPQKDIQNVSDLGDEINTALAEAKSKTSLAFDIVFSVGYEVVKDKNVDEKKVFESADRMLYEAKRKLKAQ